MTERHFLSYSVRLKVLSMLQNGYGLTQTAKAMGLKYSTVKHIREIMRRGNVGYFDRYYPFKCRTYSLEYKLAMIQSYKESGQPLKAFARENRIAHTTLKTWLDKYKAGSLC